MPNIGLQYPRLIGVGFKTVLFSHSFLHLVLAYRVTAVFLPLDARD